MKVANSYKKINDFFDDEYKWWENVYDIGLPRGFFSYEMIRRKNILIERLHDQMQKTSPIAILECGCGPGGILREISPSNNFLAGVDINFNYLTKAREECSPSSNLLQADIESLPYKSKSFDVAYCVGVLSYLDDDRYAIEEISRVMKPGGRIIISVPGYITINKLFDPYYYAVWSTRKFLDFFRNYPFNDIEADSEFKKNMIRRYRYGDLDQLFREFGLHKMQIVNVSFGPPTLWRKEILPLRHSIRISESLVRLSNFNAFNFLTRLANHWVISLEKSVCPEEEVL